MKKLKHVFMFLVLLLGLNSVLAQTKTISGTVNDTDGQPLPGANVFIKGTTYGEVTDFDGKFQIEVDDASKKTLVISYLGFVTQEIVLTGESQDLTIAMPEDANNLDEVVVLGSSVTQERKKLGNAITTIKSAKLIEAAPVSVTSSLQGKVPGAQITQNSGDPAGGFSIRLRGPSTIKGSSEPLYVVDGVIASNLTTNVTNLNVSAGDASPGQNRMVDINPNDIDNINILNGAAAAAIYGSRASNGVVVITTKKGKTFENGPEMTFKTGFNINTVRKKLDLNLIGEEFETVPVGSLAGRLWPIFGYDTETNTATPYTNLSTEKFETTRYDYQDQIFQTGFGTDNHFMARNGNGAMNYMASVGYTSNEGIIKNTKYDRFSARLKFDHNIADWISYDIGLYFSSSKSNEKPDGNVFWSPINSMNITNNVYDITQRDADGNLMAVEPTRINPLSIIETFDITQKVNRIIPNAHLKITPMENLTIDQIIGVDTYNQKGHIYIPVYPYDGVNAAYYDNGYLGNAEAKIFNWNYDITANYDWKISEKLNSSTTGGYSFQSSQLEMDATQGRGLDDTGTPTIPLQYNPVDSNLDIYGFFLQETLSYDNKLFLTVAGRIDGATNFDVDNRSNFYPKVSGSYLLSNEPFWNTDGFFNSARLRVSYGEAGNLTAISPYERFSSYTPNEFSGAESLQQNNTLGNEDLVPERTKEFEIGTDLSFWNDRAGLLLSYYSQKIEDLIVTRVLAPSIGGESRTENVGSMQNKGLEIYARITPVKTADLTWDLNLNFSTNKNKVLETTGGDITISTVAGATPIVREGEALGVFYGTYYAKDENGDLILSGASTDGSPVGVPQQERGDATTGIAQRDEDGQPTGDALRKIIGDPNPDYIMGIGTDLKYKNFNFSMLWESVQGFDVFDADKRTRQGVGLGRLAAQELTGELPRGYIAGIYPIEEFRIEDGSFVKLREVSLSYTFPSLFNDTLKNVKVSLIGRNLISFDNFWSYDPETNAGGQSNLLRSVNFGNVPIPSTFALSISTNL
ncbi:SusC/RagA family TonB-linked outer membrane protein [Maribacter polysaccharolyticus]|uniref:SusC/RagA family TonB-linked outer membrane protein n=1 Tax=Maribacter polysaccharolyticus TaxID=3020831 RepID=UPI00237F12D7|nr:SusC/RagA family TonB-linked outer membrane protein [Maribacter polysaccharolyticus]MDE3741029.1 SusC/RagA family TonB-linked outer membrane protein [Maribacter polysaccharolyticus]